MEKLQKAEAKSAAKKKRANAKGSNKPPKRSRPNPTQPPAQSADPAELSAEPPAEPVLPAAASGVHPAPLAPPALADDDRNRAMREVKLTRVRQNLKRLLDEHDCGDCRPVAPSPLDPGTFQQMSFTVPVPSTRVRPDASTITTVLSTLNGTFYVNKSFKNGTDHEDVHAAWLHEDSRGHFEDNQSSPSKDNSQIGVEPEVERKCSPIV